jgi:hypothetical protein
LAEDAGEGSLSFGAFEKAGSPVKASMPFPSVTKLFSFGGRPGATA